MQTTVPLNLSGKSDPNRGMALFARGFRPFFLLAGLAALFMMGPWLAMLSGVTWQPGYFDPLNWHRHEMLFGYTAAVVAGFLLTAVQNWTGIPTVHGKPLMALALLWLTGRIVQWFPATLPGWLIAALDISFLPALGIALAVPLLTRRQHKNYLFIPIVFVLAIANLLMHLQQLHITQDTARYGMLLAINLVIALIVIMGGRIIPFFTERALPGLKTQSWSAVDNAAVGTVGLLLIADLLFPDSVWIALICTLAFLTNAARWLGWRPWKTGTAPLLWVLHLGYGWLVLGFALKALATFRPELTTISVHAFTLGGIGGLTLGMMARVAIGHTGHQMQVGVEMALSFALIHLAALFRVALPLLFPDQYPYLVWISGALWIAAFGIFLIRYIPILIKPRADGQPG
ncbi:MAG: NnrS family protein [Pseudomonadota bacterium]